MSYMEHYKDLDVTHIYLLLQVWVIFNFFWKKAGCIWSEAANSTVNKDYEKALTR